jgi:hypothetical protein
VDRECCVSIVMDESNETDFVGVARLLCKLEVLA